MNWLTRILFRALDPDVIISVQNVVVLNQYNEPQPDVAVLRPDVEEHPGNPVPSDVLLLIEVSDTTPTFDERVKLPRYASEGVPEAWIVDLVHDQIRRYTRPEGSIYRDVATFERGNIIVSLTLPQLRLAVDDILPPNRD